MDQVPITTELLPSRDRTNVIILVSSLVPVTMEALIPSLRNLADQLEKHLDASKQKIAIPKKPSIIVP